MGIGMKELASLVGVSQITVSLVLNGKADGHRTRQAGEGAGVGETIQLPPELLRQKPAQAEAVHNRRLYADAR